MLQGLGHVTKYNDSKGSFKGIFVSPPYVLPVSYNPDGQKTFVIRGMRNSELIESLKKDPKVINFEQRISTMFSSQTLNAIYPTEIYFTIRDILPIIDKLNIKLVDKILQPLHLELLPNSINSLVDDNNVWYGKINFEEAIDNPFDISSDNYEFPALLAYQAKIYLQPQYVIFEKDKSFSTEKNWGLFYIKAKHKMPLFFIGHSRDKHNRIHIPDRLYLKEGESIPEEILNILCLSNIAPPSIASFSIEGVDSSIQKYLKFEHTIDLNIINELNKKFDLKESIINITNPKDSRSTQLLL